MRPIDIELLNELKAETYRLATLVTFAFSSPKYITDWQEGLLFQGEFYFSHAFTFESIKYSGAEIVDSIELNVDDVKRDFYEALMNKGTAVVDVSIYLVALNLYGVLIPNGYTKIYKGWISGWSYQPGLVKIQIASILSQWARISTARYSASCRWHKFGGVECKYIPGPEDTCDRTYATCEAYGNNDNFGGFRWLPDLTNKVLIPPRGG